MTAVTLLNMKVTLKLKTSFCETYYTQRKYCQPAFLKYKWVNRPEVNFFLFEFLISMDKDAHPDTKTRDNMVLSQAN
jgi:hypothetical protein